MKKINQRKILYFILSISICCISCKKHNDDYTIFVQKFSLWKPVQYYQFEGSKLYFMEDFYYTGSKKLHCRDLSKTEQEQINNIISAIENQKLKSRYFGDLHSESANEYHITIKTKTINKNFTVFQDTIQGELKPLLLFVDSIEQKAFDTIFQAPLKIQDLQIINLINHYGDTIKIDAYTNFNLWKSLVMKDLEVYDKSELQNKDFDYRFTTTYDIFYTEKDSICQIGVIDDDIYLIEKNKKISVVKDVELLIRPFLY